ncbi:MAG: ATP-grasp domain-containing protein [Christensenellaceae bacterium]|jgi:D-alanine-D-alanine ligase|nr:ATP-grasp domain-containing protein [Christensenellaceae bacterium]
MKNIAIIYGGKSPEHDVSILTGLHLYKFIKDSYNVSLIYLTRENELLLANGFLIDDYISGRVLKSARLCYFSAGALFSGGLFGKKLNYIDCVLNCTHGGIGENGALAEYFNCAGVAFSSCGSDSAKNQMSKLKTREILSKAKFDQPKFIGVNKYTDLNKIEAKIGYPMIIKPDTLGSSIGISVARDRAGLETALDLALKMDKNAIVEEFFEGITEMNVACVKEGDEILVSEVETPQNKSETYSFADKYLSRASSGKIKCAENEGDEKVKAEIQKLATRAYKLFGSTGVVRADFMIAGERIILGETNTNPGFLSYHLWLKKGVSYGEIVEIMIKEGEKRLRESQNFITNFASDVLETNRELV